MKKTTRLFKRRNKFYKNPEKQYVKKFRIYPSFLYRSLDKWLKSMSVKGWHIVHCGLFFFLFEKGEPCEKEYFTYSHLVAPNEGKYDVSLRFPFLENTYGVNKKKSQINANETKAHQIIEIDLKRIDVEKDVGYQELVSERNRLYLRHFIRNAIVMLSVFVLALLLCLVFN